MRYLLASLAIILIALPAAAEPQERPGEPMTAVSYENESLRLALGTDGTTTEFAATRTGNNYARPGVPFCRVKTADAEIPAISVTPDGDAFTVGFGESGFEARMRITAHPSYLVLEVLSFDGPAAEIFHFLDILLTLEGKPGEPFAACAMALNLRTNVRAIPQPSGRLAAECYPRFGIGGAEVAILGCPTDEMRDIMKQVVEDAPDIPKNALGGPFALDSDGPRRSYLMDTRASVTEKTVDDWIRLAEAFGIRQLDFHAGVCLRFGDYEPNPGLYPNGLESVRAVTDRLKEAGILSGLHTYAFFVAKDTPWVTPVPSPDLVASGSFTLAAPLTAEATTVPVLESTADMTTDTSFFTQNSITLRIGDELINFGGVSKEPPYAFTDCVRGAHGTVVSEHPEGAEILHLKQMFNLFVPKPDSQLFYDVIDRTAYVYNAGGFNMMYLDALDGAYVLDRPEDAWYWGSKFVFELLKRVERPPIMEMSTFSHHLWYARSRIGAWDFAKRGFRDFIDLHVLANRKLERAFLPSHLGWWGVWPWSGQDIERMFPEYIDYVCCKSLAEDSSISWIHGISPEAYEHSEYLQRIAPVIRRYEELRMEGAVPPEILARIGEPGADFTLEDMSEGRYAFRPMHYDRHLVDRSPGSDTWTVENPFVEQPAQVRIEVMLAPVAYDDPESAPFVEFDNPAAWKAPEKRENVAGAISIENGDAAFSATSEGARRVGAWTSSEIAFDTPRNLVSKGLGVWIEGDGKGEILNLQPRSPVPGEGAFIDQYVKVDFTGRRYFEFVEPEAERIADYDWPYCPRRDDWENPSFHPASAAYRCFFFPLERNNVRSFRLWYNNLPEGEPVSCRVGPIRSLPLNDLEIVDPSVTVSGKKIGFPGTLKSGEYLELGANGECRVYDANSEPVRTFTPRDEIPVLNAGTNTVSFKNNGPGTSPVRARVTIISAGEPIAWQNR